jgi:uncharacterized protein involved in exopolysaccharide biosynthesis/Mrp family chromosome partitioning ATPase
MMAEPEAPPKLLIPDLVQRFWRRRHVFAVAFAAVLGLTLLALVVLPVRYLATGSVIIAEQEPNLTETQAAWAQKIGDPADLESQLLVIRSPRVLRLAMTAPGATDAAAEDCISNSHGLLFGSTARCEQLKTDSAAFVDYVQNRYAIGAVGRSRVINISYSSGIPQVAQTMANALTTSFLDDQRAAGSNSREAAASWLRQELGRLDRELKETDEKIQSFRRTKGLMRGATAPISSERLTSISQQLSAAEAARADAAARLKEVKAAQAQGSNDVPAVLASRTVADLKQQLTSIGAQYASLSNQLGPRHPSLLALEREQASIKQRLADEVASVAASLQKTYDTNDALVGSLRKQMDSIKAEVGSATSDEASIESMVRAAEIKRQQYSDLYRRASELETERRVLLGSTRLVSLAELPTVPFFPKKLPFLAAGSTLAVLLAVVAVLLSEHLVPVRTTPGPPRLEPAEAPPPPVESVATSPAPAVLGAEPTIGDILAPFQARSPEPSPPPSPPPADESRSELAAVIGARVLASLPSLQPGSSESPIHAILSGRPASALGRALESAMHDRSCLDALARLAAELKLAPTSHRQVIVTSAAAGQGATLLTLALARFAAGAGCRVLAIECNLMHPTFHEVLPAAQGAGLLAVLRGDATPQDAVAATGIRNLDVIAAGAAASGQTGWLLRQDISGLLDWARSYDVVLIDGPPSAFLADARVPVSQVDGALICVRPGRSSIGQIVAASSAIRSLGGTVLGLAMNDPGVDEFDRDGVTSMNQLDRVG